MSILCQIAQRWVIEFKASVYFVLHALVKQLLSLNHIEHF